MAAVTISVALQKGGVGKTSTSLALASELGRRGKKVLLCDLDDQANSTYSSGYIVSDLKCSIYNVMTGDAKYHCDVKDAILTSKYYDLLPSEKAVNNLTLELKDFERLKNVLAEVKEDYDFIIIDCPPALSMLTANAFTASDNIIVTAECKAYSFLGISHLNDTINEVKEVLNPKLKVLGILLTKHDKRANVTRQIQQMIDEYSKELNTTVYKTAIRVGIAVEESQLMQIPLCDYVTKKNHNPYLDYKDFVDETLERLEMN